MAKLNYSESAPLTSGKIGGQQIIKNRHGVILQSISQPPSFGTVEQKKQRFVTNTLAQKWKQLTASQKQSYVDSALTYFKKSKTGQLINQTPYGLFLFLHQNSALLGIPGPSTAVDYQSLVEPAAYLTVKNQTTINVKSDNTVNDYEYLVIIDPRSTGYRVAQQNNELLVGKLTALELDQGIDVAPMIQNHFDFAVNMSFVSVRVTPIEIGTGRRGEEISWLSNIYVTKLVSITYPISGISSIAWNQNGSAMALARINRQMRVQNYFPYYAELNGDTGNNIFSVTPVPLCTQYADDGSFIITMGNEPGEIGFYKTKLGLPYDLNTFTTRTRSILNTNDTSNSFTISPDGVNLIIGTNEGLYKYQLLTPFDLASYSLLETNTAIKFGIDQSFVFSTDGLNMYILKPTIIEHYKVLVPFSVINIENKLLKTVDIGNVLPASMGIATQITISENGRYLTVLSNGLGTQNRYIYTILLPTPFNIGPVVI